MTCHTLINIDLLEILGTGIFDNLGTTIFLPSSHKTTQKETHRRTLVTVAGVQ
jgi:hypothetical protein